MKVMVIGGTGTIGRPVVEALQARHEVISVGHRRGALTVDITDDGSVAALFAKVGGLDAVVVATGDVHFGTLAGMSAEQFNIGLQGKLLGQVRVALAAQHQLNDGGSITLTTGITAGEPIAQGSNATTVGAAIEGFVLAAATELPRSIRINAISPNVLDASAEAYGDFFPGFGSVSGAEVAQAYRRSVEGVQTGRVYRVW